MSPPCGIGCTQYGIDLISVRDESTWAFTTQDAPGWAPGISWPTASGEAGAQLVAALQSGRELNPVLVVDDDPGKQGSLLCGVPVVNRQGLQAKAKQGAVSTVLLALPTCPGTAAWHW